ncbi:MAG: DNA polymerase III subunit gamma/tau [Bacteroidetes bacterium]|jgi:DNA polymerase-3 subunit gamma/tau|nr:DNA polymerase III subunit gamma/tau [Bacteroidota bacterium]
MPQNYRALTRTYRPQSFEDIVSQEHVSNTLKNAIKQDRLSHAYMFCGPRGVGKTTMARVLARTINSIDTEVDGESLNQTLNVVEIDAASNNKVDDIHHLRESIRIPPQNGRYKVFIVDEVHMLSKAAFNALLKTLEEPPAHAIFIFATTEPHKVLPTILSRVQRFDFKRISVDEIVSRLQAICKKEGIMMDEESLHVIAKKADGALRDALGLMDQAIAFCGEEIQYNELIKALNVVGGEQLFRFLAAVENKDADAGLKLVDELMRAGVDIQEFLSALTEHLRNLYVALNSSRMYLVDATADTKQRYAESAKAFSEEDLMRMLHMVSESQMKIRDVQQPRVHFEILMLKLIHMNRSKELNALIEELHHVKKNGRIQVADTSPEDRDHQDQDEESPVDAEPASDAGDSRDENSSMDDAPAVREDPGADRLEEAEHSTRGDGKETGDEAEAEGSPDIRAENEVKNDPESSKSHTSGSAGGAKNGAEHSDDSEMDDFMMVKPALGFAEGISSTRGVRKEEGAVDTLTEEHEPESEPVELSGVEDVEKHWDVIKEEVKKSAPHMLYYQLLRVQLKDLEGVKLTVSADSEFATNMFDENQELLSDIMKRVLGVRIRINCIVERSEKKKETKSPYERFKELQKKDPHLKSVVELFGAELDY